MTIDERLENLERELAGAKRRNRRLLAAVGLAVGVFALVWIVVAGATRAEAEAGGIPTIVRAGRFELVDENGKTRAELTVTKLGPGLALYDENGKPRARLGVGKDMPGLWLFDENGKPRAMLAAGKDQPMLSLCDENGNQRAIIGTNKDGPRLCLLDESGKAVWKAP